MVWVEVHENIMLAIVLCAVWIAYVSVSRWLAFNLELYICNQQACNASFRQIQEGDIWTGISPLTWWERRWSIGCAILSYDEMIACKHGMSRVMLFYCPVICAQDSECEHWIQWLCWQLLGVYYGCWFCVMSISLILNMGMLSWALCSTGFFRLWFECGSV